MTLSDVLKARKLVWKRRPEILLCPNIPKPMHGVSPRVILGQTWWNKTRQEAYQSTAYHCIACGVEKLKARFRKWLEAHELYDLDYQRGRMVYAEAVPLCHACHNYIHDGRLAALLDLGKVSQSKFASIIRHGDKVLSDAKLHRLPKKQRDLEMIDMLLSNTVCEWKDWRLILNGKEYPPKFKSEAQWRKALGK